MKKRNKNQIKSTNTKKFMKQNWCKFLAQIGWALEVHMGPYMQKHKDLRIWAPCDFEFDIALKPF